VLARRTELAGAAVGVNPPPFSARSSQSSTWRYPPENSDTPSSLTTHTFFCGSTLGRMAHHPFSHVGKAVGDVIE
jgi:hypothetical protein